MPAGMEVGLGGNKRERSRPVRGDGNCGRSKVLRKLGHVSPDGLVLVKGQAACLIMAADELLCTEMMFNGTFKGLEPAKLVALVSCLIPTDKTNVGSPFPTDF